MATNAIKKRLHVYFSNDGTLLDKQGDLSANPLDDEVFEINAYIQDGVVDNQTTLINFTPIDKTAYTSHWFTMFYRELVDYVIPGDTTPTNFARFVITVPSIVLLVKNGKTSFEQKIAIIQRYGNTHLGNFETITDLNVAYPPTPTLDNNNDVAYVYSNESGETEQIGFYQVEYVGSTYVWVKKTTLLYNLQTKQYNTIGFTVNTGASNPSGVPTINESIIYQFMQEISFIYIDINQNASDIFDLRTDLDAHVANKANPHEVQANQVPFDNTGTDLTSIQTEEAIKEVNDKSNANEQNIADMKDGTDEFTEINLGGSILRYNNTLKVVEIVYQDGTIGQVNMEMWAHVRNEDTSTALNGEVVAINGAVGQTLAGVKADPSDYSLHFKELGVVTMVDGIVVNGTGKVTNFGIVNDIPVANLENTGIAYAENQELFVSVNGKMTNVEPSAPIAHVHVGWVLRVLGGSAIVFVNFIQVPHLEHLSDVSGSGWAENDILVRGANGVWTNSQRLVTVEGKVSTLETEVQALEDANMIKSYTYNPATHVLTFTYFDNTTTSFDLPLESAIIDASYDNVTKDITFTLQSGATLVVPLDDLVSGLASETWVTTYFIPKTSIVDNLTTDDATKVLSAKQGKALQDTKVDKTTYPINIYNHQTSLYNNLFNPTTGAPLVVNGYYLSDFIQVDYLKTYTISNGNSSNLIALYDINQIYLGKVNGVVGDNSSYTFTITNPNIKYIRININPRFTPVNKYMVVNGTSLPSVYLPYNVLINELIDYKISGENIYNRNNKFKNKVMYLFGDSITYWDQRYDWIDGNTYIKGYPSYISEEFSLKQMVNLAVSGSTITTVIGNSIYTELTTTNLSNVDIILINGGANDIAQGSTLGSLGNRTDTTFDSTTFYGALRGMIQYAYSQNPNINIYLLGPIQMLEQDMILYNTAFEEVGNMYGIPVLKMNEEVEINVTNNSSVTFDGVHPNNEGYKKMAKSIIGFLNTK